jgi:polyhydroxyalkanoate synthesis regulator phasin
VNFAAEYKDNIRLQNSIETILDKAKLPDKDSIKQLTKAIAKLAGEVEELKAQKRSGHV